MSRTSQRGAGFTLIELTITVAIIGILASTAIGLFRIQQLRAKRTEAMTNLEAVGRLERGFYGENGVYPSAIPVPLAGTPGVKTNWDAASSAAFGAVGFETEGAVYFVYDVNSPTGLCAGCPSGGCFTASAYGDSDLDGAIAVVGYFHADDAGAACQVQVFPAIGQTIDPVPGVPLVDAPVSIPTPLADDY